MTIINFNVVPPIKLRATQSGLAVGPKGDPGATGADGLSAYEVAVENGFVGTEQEWLDSIAIDILTGAKSSAIDAGTFGDISLTDDYMYVCTQTGTAGNAIWKKVVMFQT